MSVGCEKLFTVHESRATLQKRRSDVSAMFDTVAQRYDLMNFLLTLGVEPHWRKDVTAEIDPKPGQLILDLAAGTGASAVPLAAAGATVVCADLSMGMLTEGQHRHPELHFVAGDALHLPFEDDSFDTVTISFGLRNVEDTVGALAEMRRVTRPGGQLLVCEFSTPANPAFRSLYNFYQSTVMPLGSKVLASNAVAYDYLIESIRDWPAQQELADLISQAGWQAVGWRNLAGGIVALHRAWNA